MRTLGILLAASCLLASACTTNRPPGSCTSCGADCVDFKSDDAHCGTCAKACGATEHCANSGCWPTACGTTACDADSVCVDAQCVARDCVGVICGVGQACSRGVCTCASGRLDCGGECVDPKVSDANCGGCGHACTADTACADGACLPSDCPGKNCDPLSVCYQGDCADKTCVGVVCPSGQSCHQGACGCTSAETMCAGRCVRTTIDSQNCGSCGHACAAGEGCAAGQCLPNACGSVSCDPLSVCFQGSCAEAACVGVVCTPGQTCSGGLCSCPAGQYDCGDSCAALATDVLNCGVCGNRCTPGQDCVNGTCTVSGCPAGKRVCGAECVDVQTNPDNCSACGNACGGGRNCVGGACQCPQGLAYCNGSCVDLLTDGNNCNGCGRSCNGGTCGGGVCACPSQQTLCSGTCRATQTDPMNCGLCNRGCDATQMCSNGSCVCASGRTLCGGTCIPTANDDLNCGGCNNVCGANTHCVGSTCQPDFTCQTMFTSAPSDCPLFPVDASLCGVATQSGTQNFSGAPGPMVVLSNFTVASNERVEVAGHCDGANGSATLRGTNGYPITMLYCGSGGGTTAVDWKFPGSIYSCANPAQFAVGGCNVYACGYDLNVIRYTMNGKYNTGGQTAGTASMLTNGASGRVCDQVCGNLLGICMDDQQHYRLDLPAGKAAVIDGVFSGRATTSTFDLVATTGAGGTICNLVNNGTATNVPSSYRARIVNNTTHGQTINIMPFVNTGELGWNMSVAVEQ